MNYRFIDRGQVTASIRKNDALNAEFQAIQTEIIARAVTGPERNEQLATAAEFREKARTKLDAVGLTNAEVVSAVRDFLASWLQPIEHQHVEVETQMAIAQENAERCEGCEANLANLTAVLKQGHAILDGLPTSVKLNGDGGTANRQTRRRKASAKKAGAKS